METERLYYQDVDLLIFDGQVVDSKVTDGMCWVALDQTAFYPTGGGQPHDTGVLQLHNGHSIAVLDVEAEDGVIWHRVVEAIAVGERVRGSVDGSRRRDHMEQHGAEHLIAGLMFALHQGVTRGLHIGSEFSTMDVKLPEQKMRLTQEEIDVLEQRVNQRIRENAPIRAFFPTSEELKILPLRKQPTVDTHVRVIAAGDYEMVPCGGTHPKQTGHIGLIKVIGTHPARGYVRISFVAGERAVRYVQQASNAAQMAAAALSCKMEGLLDAVEALKGEKEQGIKRVSQMNQRLAAQLVAGRAVKTRYGLSFAHMVFDDDMEMDLLRVAREIKEIDVVLLAQRKQTGLSYLLHTIDPDGMTAKTCIRQLHIKGGGSDDLVQGKTDEQGLASMVKYIMEQEKAPEGA